MSAASSTSTASRPLVPPRWSSLPLLPEPEVILRLARSASTMRRQPSEFPVPRRYDERRPPTTRQAAAPRRPAQPPRHPGAARQVFCDHGLKAPLEQIARRAGAAPAPRTATSPAAWRCWMRSWPTPSKPTSMRPSRPWPPTTPGTDSSPTWRDPAAAGRRPTSGDATGMRFPARSRHRGRQGAPVRAHRGARPPGWYAGRSSTAAATSPSRRRPTCWSATCGRSSAAFASAGSAARQGPRWWRCPNPDVVTASRWVSRAPTVKTRSNRSAPAPGGPGPADGQHAELRSGQGGGWRPTAPAA
jgi:hypothetical protein